MYLAFSLDKYGRLAGLDKVSKLNAQIIISGFKANGMTVWNVKDSDVKRLGRQIGELPYVSHCYQRPRHEPHWSYNLFAMVHGTERAQVEERAEKLKAILGDSCLGNEILYSSKILKKTGMRLKAKS